MTYEEQYINNLRNILENGILEKNERTGISTYRLPSTQIVVDLEKEFPILRSKKVFWKSALNEILWIMQKNSNNINELNSKIWDQWADKNGSIGKTYGYQVGKPVLADKNYKNQVDYVLQKLESDPSSRQAVIDMWDPEEIKEMNLPPCVFSSVWSIINGKLNCMVVQRSSDYPVGVPFDTMQYGMLVHMFARHLGVKPGILTHVMADSHIYENQIEGVKQQLEQFEELKAFGRLESKDPSDKPVFLIDENKKNFWEMTEDDMQIINYEPMNTIKFEVAK